MSDSEFEGSSVVSAVAVAPSKKASKKPTKKAAGKQIRERDTSPYPDFVRGSAAAGRSKRKTSPPPELISNKRSKRTDIFNILQTEEAGCSKPRPRDGGVTSSFSSRVSTGTSRRAVTSSGDYFVDLKVYKTSDYKNSAPDVRFKKALVTVKLQCDESSPTWESLQGFLGRSWSLFEEAEPVHYSDKINFK